MLEDMGFTRAQATKALRVNGNNPEVAVAWLFENPDDPGEDADAPDTASAPGPSSGDSSAIGDSSTLPARYRIKAFISHKGVRLLRADLSQSSGFDQHKLTSLGCLLLAVRAQRTCK